MRAAPVVGARGAREERGTSSGARTRLTSSWLTGREVGNSAPSTPCLDDSRRGDECAGIVDERLQLGVGGVVFLAGGDAGGEYCRPLLGHGHRLQLLVSTRQIRGLRHSDLYVPESRRGKQGRQARPEIGVTAPELHGLLVPSGPLVVG